MEIRWWRGCRCVAVGIAVLLTPFSAPKSIQAQEGAPDSLAYFEGDRAASVTVTEYLDFGCSACALFANTTLPVLREEYIESGRVAWRTVPFVLGSFPNGEAGARAAWCASRQGRFRAYHDALFSQRHRWVRERDPEEALILLAGTVGVEEDPFATCYRSEASEKRVERQTEAAREARIRGTPAFEVRGRLLLGALEPRAFRAVLDQLLAHGPPAWALTTSTGKRGPGHQR